MTIDTTNMQPDDLVRRWPAECSREGYDDALPEGSCIALFFILLFTLIAIGSFVAAIY